MQRKQKFHHIEQRSPYHSVVHSKLGEMVDGFCLLLFFLLVDPGTFLALHCVSPAQHDNVQGGHTRALCLFIFILKFLGT